MKKLQNEPNKTFIQLKTDREKIKKIAIYFIALIVMLGSFYGYSRFLRAEDSRDTHTYQSDEEILDSSSEVMMKNDELEYISSDYGISNNTNGLSMFLKVIICLVIVIILIYLTARFIRFFNRIRDGFPKSDSRVDGLIKVLDSKMIEQKKSVHLINVAGEYLIVGSSESQLNFIGKITKEQYKKSRNELEEQKDVIEKEMSFKNILSNYFSNKKEEKSNK